MSQTSDKLYFRAGFNASAVGRLGRLIWAAISYVLYGEFYL